MTKQLQWTGAKHRIKSTVIPSEKNCKHPFELTDDDFVQADALYRDVMTDEARNHFIGNIIDHLKDAQKRIQLRQTALFFKSDPEYGRRVAEGLHLDVQKV